MQRIRGNSFEKQQEQNVEIKPLGCSGCSNKGQKVHSSNYSSQAASSAGRCSAS